MAQNGDASSRYLDREARQRQRPKRSGGTNALTSDADTDTHEEQLDNGASALVARSTTQSAAYRKTPQTTRKGRGEDESSYTRPIPRYESEGSLARDIYNDLFRLPRRLYPWLRWPLFFYIVWMVVSYSMVFCLNKVSKAVEPVCRIPFVGHVIPFCAVGGAGAPPLDLRRMADSQEHLDDVMLPAGRNRNLARDMINHEYAVRDLKIRVAASDLKRKRELEEQFGLLIRRTKDAARGLSRFTAKVSKSVDAVITIDEHVARKLEVAVDVQTQPRSLPGAIVKMLNPVSAFRVSTNGFSDEELKEIFLKSTSRIATEIHPLIAEAFELRELLDVIQTNLDRIQELTHDELGDLPRKEVLALLWSQLARADEYAQYKNHKQLLGDLTKFYQDAGEVMKVTGYALDRSEVELETFRDEFSAPSLVMREDPLEVIIARLRSSTKRLEAGRRVMDGVEAPRD